MKTLYINVQVLSILFISLVGACSPKSEKKEVESKHYLEQLLKNHVILRNEIRSFGERLPHLNDSAEYFNTFSPFMIKTDSIMYSIPNDSLIIEMDSFMLSLNERLYYDYSQLIHIHFRELHHIYRSVKDSLNEVQQMRVDSIWSKVSEIDSQDRQIFFQYFPVDSIYMQDIRSLVPTE